MTSAQASRMVLISMGILAFITLSAHRDDASKEQRFRSLWAIAALGLGLSVLADMAPQVAGPFALLVAVAMVSRNPGELGKALGFGATVLPAGATRGYGNIGPRPEEGTVGARGQVAVPPARSTQRQSGGRRGGV